MRRLSPLLIVLLFGLAGAARADLIAYDGFDDPPGTPLVGQAGGTGFSTAWAPGGFNAPISNNFNVAPGSLAFGDLRTSGQHVSTDVTANIAGVTRTLSQRFGPGSTFYLSVLLRPEGTVGDGIFGGFFGLYLDSASANDPDLFLGKPGNRDQYVLENRGGGGQSVSNYSAVSDQTTLLVLKGELVNGNDTFTLWINRPLGGPDPSSFDARKTDIDIGSFQSLVLYSTGAFSVDEIRIGTTYADVTPLATAVPEPSSLALAALGGGLMIALRRARRRG